MSSILFATELQHLAPLAVAVPFGFAALLAVRFPLPFRRQHAELVAAAVALFTGVLCAMLLVKALDSEGPLVSWLGGWEPRPASPTRSTCCNEARTPGCSDDRRT